MKYTLMHKDVPVAQLNLDEATAAIQRIYELTNEMHIPVGVPVKKGAVDRAALNSWWINRSIPASRSGVRQVLETLGLDSTRMLLTKSLGLSLSDQYWIKPDGSLTDWNEINFFEHSFSEDIGNALLGKPAKTDGILDFNTPDNTSDGCLKKRWKIIDGKRCLIKGGSAPFLQQPFNEVIASSVMERLGIPHVPYTIMWDGDEPYSVCEDFITPETELVSAWYIMKTQKKENSTSIYRHYLNCCKSLGVTDIEHAVNQMIVLDYIIANEDRHQNNFGLVRNANTLEWLGAAPIFDSGSSLGYDKLPSQISSNRGVGCKPFKNSHEEQIKLVTSFDWIMFDRLKGLDKEMLNIFGTAGESMDFDRKNVIVSSVNKRIMQLEGMAISHKQYSDSAENDVKEDIAEDYGPTLG